jgi:hypothetical protein
LPIVRGLAVAIADVAGIPGVEDGAVQHCQLVNGGDMMELGLTQEQ